MILTVLIFIIVLFCEKILTFYVCFFLAYFKTGSCCKLEILWIQDSNRCIITTPYNVGSVLWRLFSTLEVVQYIGGITSVLWGIASILWGIASVLWGIASLLWRLFSTVGG